MTEKIAIVVGTSEGRSIWVNDFLKSVNVPIPVLVVNTDGYELGKIRWVFEHTRLDRFAFFQDSIVIRDNDLLMQAFEGEGSACLFHDRICFNGYNGLYDRSVLDTMEIPVAYDKTDSITYEEQFTQEYIRACPAPPRELSGQVAAERAEMRHGRLNTVYQNAIVEKWKGNWGQIPRDEWNTHDETYIGIVKDL